MDMGIEKSTSAVITWREAVFYLYFAVMLFGKGIGLYEGMTAYKLCLVISAVLLLIKLLLDDYSLKEMTVMTGLVLLGVLIWRNSGEKGPLLYILLVIGMKKVPVKRVFTLGAVVWGAAFMIQLVSALTGIRQGVFMAHDKLGLGHIIRWSLGYPHPNVLHISYVILIAFLLYVFDLKGRKLIAATLLCFAGNLYIFLYSISYTGFMLTVVYLLCNLYFCFRTGRTAAENILIQLAFPACVIFSVAGPLIFPEKLFDLCNKIFNTRFLLSRVYMTQGSWNLFGDRQEEIHAMSSNYTLDCSYTYLLMYCGIVIFVLVCAGYILLINWCVRTGRNKELAIIIGLSVAGISEPFLFNTAYKNLALIYMGSAMFEALENQGGRRLYLLPFGDRRLVFPIRGLTAAAAGMQAAWKRSHKALLVLGMVCALGGGVLYALNAWVPDSIYILKAGSDRYEKEVYLDINNLPENFNSRIVSYVDENTPMYEFSGNMVIMEYVRGIVSSALAGGSTGLLLGWLFVYGREKRENTDGQ